METKVSVAAESPASSSLTTPPPELCLCANDTANHTGWQAGYICVTDVDSEMKSSLPSSTLLHVPLHLWQHSRFPF